MKDSLNIKMKKHIAPSSATAPVSAIRKAADTSDIKVKKIISTVCRLYRSSLSLKHGYAVGIKFNLAYSRMTAGVIKRIIGKGSAFSLKM